MYAAVPCYNLKKLHEAIQADLQPCPAGLWASWKLVLEILKKQKSDPSYYYAVDLPGGPAEPEVR